jgi:hypothetical protein
LFILRDGCAAFRQRSGSRRIGARGAVIAIAAIITTTDTNHGHAAASTAIESAGGAIQAIARIAQVAATHVPDLPQSRESVTAKMKIPRLMDDNSAGLTGIKGPMK